MTAWILGFAEFVAEALARDGGVRRAGDSEALRRLLNGPLDWLDATWLAPRLESLGHAPPSMRPPLADSTRRLLGVHDEQTLERLTALAREGGLRLDRAATRDEAIVQLVAMAGQEDTAGPPDRALVAVIDAIVDAWRAELTRGTDEERALAVTDSAGTPSHCPARADAVPDVMLAVRTAGPAAVELLRQLVKGTAAMGEAGGPTAGGGLFLLTRALLDVRLSALAREAAVPFDGLRGALAVEWLGLRPPFDGPASLWVGATNPDFAMLDAPGTRFADLEQALVELLVDQRCLDAPPSEELLPNENSSAWAGLVLTAEAAGRLERIAWMVMRAWSRWLPGIAGASMEFLVGNCLQRSGRVRISPGAIAVELDPAPLDVVLEMAGYFGPITAIPWLDGRTVTFTVRHPRA
jgi:hypothetical protein